LSQIARLPDFLLWVKGLLGRSECSTRLTFPIERIIVLMAAMTPKEAHAYFKRWELVEEFELIELRRTSMDIKLRQLSALMSSRKLFGEDPEREHGVQLVRDRWACLRQALGE